MSFSFFKVPPTMNDATITEAINTIADDTGEISDQVLSLLIKTRAFLTKTAPSADMRNAREQWQKDEDRKKILDNIADALTSFKSKDHPKAKQYYDSCKATVAERIRLLLMVYKEDKISIYYQSHDNSLKTILEPPSPRLVK